MKKNNTGENHKEAKVNKSWQTMEGLTIGIDLGDKRSCYCVLDRAGNKIEENSLSNTSTRWRNISAA
jgi:hypothetical protein